MKKNITKQYLEDHMIIILDVCNMVIDVFLN
jgi:general stress protein CsbA